jgi:DNA-damage-inducible protein D
MSDLTKYNIKTFEKIKRYTDEGIEFWYARELQEILEYTEWRNFENVIQKAIISAENSVNNKTNWVVEVNKPIKTGKGKLERIKDYQLSRYICYLIVQNADPTKKIVALGQTYFALQTRKQELVENYNELTEDQKRLAIRNELIEHNKSLSEAANQAGIKEPKDYAIFQNYGYQGLYNGLGKKEIHERKKLKKTQKILDHMGSTELAANLFRATQTEEKLRRENIKGKTKANKTHFEVGQKVRQTIKEIGGTMPENLPTPEKSIKTIESNIKKLKSNKSY